MCAKFSDDDVGKTVHNAAGDEVGIVADVERGTAHVEPDPGITDTIKAKLGWGGTDEEAYPLQEDAVDRVTSDAIHLKGDLGDETRSGRGTTEMGDDNTGLTDNDDSMMSDDDSGLTDDDESLMGDDDETTRR